MKPIDIRFIIEPFIILLILLHCGLSRADEVIMKNGTVIECIVLEETPSYIVIDKNGMKISLPKANIKSIKKTSAIENLVQQGNAFFEQKKYEQAIQSYSKVYRQNPNAVRAKILEARNAMVRQMRDKYANEKNLDWIEKDLRKQLAHENLDPHSYSPTKEKLAVILMIRAEPEKDRVNYGKYQDLLEEAWQLSPDTSGLAITLATFLSEQRDQEERVVEILFPYLKFHPNDLNAMNLFLEHSENAPPWIVLQILFPDAKPYPNCTPQIMAIIQRALLDCFYTQPYPDKAPFDRITCYEHLLKLNPGISPLPLLKLKVETDPESAENHYELGQYYSQQKEYENAIGELEKALSLKNEPRIEIALQQAREFHQANREKKAQGELTEIEKVLQAGKPIKAQKECEDLLSWIPDYENAKEFLGKVRHLEQCKSCAGTGKALCQECDGTGHIYADVPVDIRRSVFRQLTNYECKKCGLPPLGDIPLINPIYGTRFCLHGINFNIYKCRSCGYLDMPIVMSNSTPTQDEKDLLGSITGDGDSRLNVRKMAYGGGLAFGNPKLDEHLRPKSACPRCKKPYVEERQSRQEPIPCERCKGQGRAGKCQACAGTGLITMEMPRKSPLGSQYVPEDQFQPKKRLI